MTDLYGVLGLSVNATPKEVTAAYRKLAKKHHPDMNVENSGQYFIQIKEAYSVLSDPQRRAVYDRFAGYVETDGSKGRTKAREVFRQEEQTFFEKVKSLSSGFTFVFSALLGIILIAFAGSVLLAFPLGSYFLLSEVANIPLKIFIVFTFSVLYWIGVYRVVITGKINSIIRFVKK